MKTKTRIDSAGRLVIPKELRKRYGMDSGTEVQIVPLPDGISLIPSREERKLVKQGNVLSIDTGKGTGNLEMFSADIVRNEQLNRKDDIG
jgi:AbrB family looped-hinge helix DNA binding protein